MLASVAEAHRATNVTTQVVRLRQGVVWQRSMTWHWQDVAGLAHTRTRWAERHITSPAFLRWDISMWNRRRKAARHKAASLFVGHYALWMCIHSGEAGDWHNEDTGGNGHYGGLQMSWSWGWNRYAHYGLSGDPAHYSEAEQLAAAERGYQANGYSRSWLLGQWYHPECLGYA